MIVLALFGFLPTIARKSLKYNKKGCAFAQPFWLWAGCVNLVIHFDDAS